MLFCCCTHRRVYIVMFLLYSLVTYYHTLLTSSFSECHEVITHYKQKMTHRVEDTQ